MIPVLRACFTRRRTRPPTAPLPTLDGVTGRPDLRPAARLLVEAVAPSRPDGGAGPDEVARLAGEVDVDVVARAAGQHRVLPALARLLAEQPTTPDAWRPALRRARRQQALQHLGTVAEAVRLGKVLDDAGVPWLVAKGPVAAADLWPAPDLRQYYDLDLYVPRRAFADAVVALEEAGCEGVDRNWPLMLAEMRAEYAVRAPQGTHVDLHWDYAVPAALRARFRTDLDGMVARRRRVDVGGGQVLWCPDPADTVVLLAFHAAQASANRLVWLADVRFALLAAGAEPGALADVVARAAAGRVQRPVALVVARAARVLGLPADVAASLAPLVRRAGVLGRAAEAQDARAPFPWLPGDPHRGGALYAAARPRLVTTAGALVSGAVRTRRIEKQVRLSPAAAEKELRRDVPDGTARREYLRRSVGG